MFMSIVGTSWVMMWLIGLVIFFSAKALTNHAVPSPAGLVRLGYWFAWPGLDAERFLRNPARVPRPALSEWCFAVSKTLLGAMLFWFGGLAVADKHGLTRGWLGMIGVVFVLHFRSEERRVGKECGAVRVGCAM